MLYTLLASAKRHHLDPQVNLTDVLRRLRAITNSNAPRYLLPNRC